MKEIALLQMFILFIAFRFTFGPFHTFRSMGKFTSTFHLEDLNNAVSTFTGSRCINFKNWLGEEKKEKKT